MKRFFVAMLCSLALSAQASPSDSDIQAYKDRMNLYFSLKQTPEEVVVSLRNYFGKPNFCLHSNGWDQTSDIQYVEGEGTEITFLATLATVTQ